MSVIFLFSFSAGFEPISPSFAKQKGHINCCKRQGLPCRILPPQPRRRKLHIACGDFLSPRTHSAAPPLRNRSRSSRLFGCKRPHNGFVSLPPCFGLLLVFQTHFCICCFWFRFPAGFEPISPSFAKQKGHINCCKRQGLPCRILPPQPRRRKLHIACGDFLSPRTHSAAPPLRNRSRSSRLFGCKRPHNGFVSLPLCFGLLLVFQTHFCKCFFQFYSPCGEFYCFAVIYGFQPSDIALWQLKRRIEYHCDDVAISLLRKQKYHAEQSEAYH